MEGPPLGRRGEDITWPNQVAPRGRKASSTRKIKPQTSNLLLLIGPQTFMSFSLVMPVIAQQEGRTKWQQSDQASERRNTSPAPA